MQLADPAREALRTLRTQPMRTALTLFGLVWGTASVIFLLSWGLGVERMLESGYTRVGRNLVQAWAGKIGEQFTPAADRRQLWFTLDDVRALRAEVRRADLVLGEARAFRVVGFRQRSLSLDVRGIEPQHAVLRGVVPVAGRAIGRTDGDHRRRVAVLGDTARRNLLGAEAGVGAWIRIAGRRFRVIGLLPRIGTQLWQDGPSLLDEQVWIPLQTSFAFGQRWGTDDDVIDSIEMRARDRRDTDALKREVRTILARRLRISPTDDEAVLMASPLDALRQLPLDQMRGLLFTLGATTLVIGGVGLLTMMLDAVHERRQEIGVRLAVGARRRDILRQFLLETLFITALGGAVGLALGVGGCWLLMQVDAPDLIPIPILRGEVVAIALAVMGTVGLASGVVPAWRAARVDPSITLRAE